VRQTAERETQSDVDPERDRLLVMRCQGGDGAAFSELYCTYHDRLVRFCAKRLGDPHEAEDAVQEAFVRAWRALDRFGGRQSFYPWLSVIAANVCTDALRKRGRNELLADGSQPTAAPQGEDITDRLLAAEEAATVTRAIRRLKGRHQRVLYLREGLGWSVQDIATHEGVAANAADTLLWRARLALKREFRALSEGVPAILGLGTFRMFVIRRRLGDLANRLNPRAGIVPGLRFRAVLAASVVISGGAVAGTSSSWLRPNSHHAELAHAAVAPTSGPDTPDRWNSPRSLDPASLRPGLAATEGTRPRQSANGISSSSRSSAPTPGEGDATTSAASTPASAAGSSGTSALITAPSTSATTATTSSLTPALSEIGTTTGSQLTQAVNAVSALPAIGPVVQTAVSATSSLPAAGPTVQTATSAATNLPVVGQVAQPIVSGLAGLLVYTAPG
jgi:RNA polymerase sigma factor (sigma-70 family)